MFNKTLIAAAILFSGTAFATESTGVAGGTITFNGAVSDTTCDVTSSNGADFTVNLSPVTKTDIGTTPGIVTAAKKDFIINVKNCSAVDDTTKTLKVTFSSSNISDDGKYLKNFNEDGAEGVGIALTSDGSVAVPLESAFDTGLTVKDVSSTEGASITLYANYYNYGGATTTTGKVVSDATYSFSYD